MLGMIHGSSRRCEDGSTNVSEGKKNHTTPGHGFLGVSHDDMIRKYCSTRGFRSHLICDSFLHAGVHTGFTCIPLRQRVGKIGPKAPDRR